MYLTIQWLKEQQYLKDMNENYSKKIVIII